MNVDFPGQAMPLADVKPGSVFGMFVQGEYVRFLRIDEPGRGDGIVVLCLGPYLEGPPEVNEAGPTVHVWGDEGHAIVETNLFLMPRRQDENGHLINPVENARAPLGAVMMAGDGGFYIYARSGRGRRSWINAVSGKPADHTFRPVGFFPHYFLLEKNGAGGNRVIFDSLAEQRRLAPKLSA